MLDICSKKRRDAPEKAVFIEDGTLIGLKKELTSCCVVKVGTFIQMFHSRSEISGSRRLEQRIVT